MDPNILPGDPGFPDGLRTPESRVSKALRGPLDPRHSRSGRDHPSTSADPRRPEDPAPQEASDRLSDTRAAADADPATTPDGSDPAPDPSITIPVRFNHEDRQLSLEEARTLAQKGLKFDELAPTLEKLRFLAAAEGLSLSQLADTLITRQNQQLYQALLQECGGNEAIARRLFAAEQADWQARYQAGQQDEARAAELADQQRQEDLTGRLAREFLELREAFPEVTAITAVPRPVLALAVEQGIPLTDAYLRYQHRQQQNIAAALAAEQAAAGASPGSQAAGGDDGFDPTFAAFVSGVGGRL